MMMCGPLIKSPAPNILLGIRLLRRHHPVLTLQSGRRRRATLRNLPPETGGITQPTTSFLEPDLILNLPNLPPQKINMVTQTVEFRRINLAAAQKREIFHRPGSLKNLKRDTILGQKSLILFGKFQIGPTRSPSRKNQLCRRCRLNKLKGNREPQQHNKNAVTVKTNQIFCGMWLLHTFPLSGLLLKVYHKK